MKKAKRKKIVLLTLLHLVIIISALILGKLYSIHQTKTNHYLLNANIKIDILPRADLYLNKNQYTLKTYIHEKSFSRVYLYRKKTRTTNFELKENVYFYISTTNTYLKRFFDEDIMDRDVTGGVSFHKLYADKVQTHNYKGFKAIDNKSNNSINGICCVYKGNYMILLNYNLRSYKQQNNLKNAQTIKKIMNKTLNRFTGID